jgi:photosystem II stability/assembly factor-like uncharacterized protein
MRRSLVLLALAAGPAFAADPPKELAAVKYRLVGPYAGGRVSRACGVPGDPLTYFAATASGGVWKSTDGGLNWSPVFDDQPTSSIGSIAVAPSDRNVVYVGTGEANIRGNVAPGAGLFKSEDGGKTWKHVWKQVGQIGTVAVHPKNADIAFAAVLGHAFGPNPDRGVYRTTDGGKSWNRVYFKDDQTGASDVAIDPSNPRVIFAGMWQARRRPWELTSGGPGSDLAVSRDGGDTWVSLKTGARENGLPAGVWGKVGVAVAPSNGQRVYAIIEADKGGLFRSDDGGKSWALVNDTRPIRQRAWYYHTLTVHPTNPDEVYAPQVPLLKSTDGGRTFRSVRGPHHGDHHDLWIDPLNPQRMINSNDGGVDITADGGKTWYAPPLPITQFYHVHADNAVPYRVMGCMQDLGSAAGPSRSLTGRIGPGEWQNVGGGEAGHCVSDPSDPDVIYAGEYGGILTRFDRKTGQARNVSVNANNPTGIDPAKMPRRFQWTAPVLISKHDPKTVYHAANTLFRTRDAGTTWEAVSKDLTRDDKQKQGWSGGPITGDNTGAEVYCTIFALAESPKQKGVLWAGTDDGKVWLTTDDCNTWTDLTANVPELPDWGTVTCIEASPFDVNTAYLVIDNHRMDDYRPHVWKTTDGGKTWTAITDGLDSGTHTFAVREDPKKKDQLYLGTARGVMLSPDGGKTWKSLQLNLPTVPVHDLVVKDDDLVVGTHGRSIWILDDLTPVRAKPADAAVHLYPVAPATKWAYGGGPATGFTRSGSTSNPPAGAVVWYHLGKDINGDVTLEVLTADGKPVAKAKGKAGEKGADDEDDDDAPPGARKDRPLDAKPGLNRFVWDLTHDGAEAIPGAFVDLGQPSLPVPAAAGTYTLKLTAAGKTVEGKVEVKPDPRLPGKGTEQEAIALKVRDDITLLTRTVLRLRAVQRQLALRKDLLKDHPDANELLEASDALGKKLTALEERLHNPKAKVSYDIFGPRGGAMLYSQLAWLLVVVCDGDGPPNKAQQQYAVEHGKQLAGLVAEFDKLMKGDVAALNDQAAKLGVPGLYVPPAKK